MQSSLIGKIEKAKRYALEPDRVCLSQLTASFRGEHDTYTLNYQKGKWSCTCRFFAGWGTCSHTMALERILGNMLARESASPQEASPTLT